MSLPSLVGKPRSWLVDAVSVSPSHVQHSSQQMPLPSWPCGLRLKQSFIDLIDPVYRTWAKGAQRIKPVCYWTSFKQRWDFLGLFLLPPPLFPPSVFYCLYWRSWVWGFFSFFSSAGKIICTLVLWHLAKFANIGELIANSTTSTTIIMLLLPTTI